MHAHEQFLEFSPSPPSTAKVNPRSASLSRVLSTHKYYPKTIREREREELKMKP